MITRQRLRPHKVMTYIWKELVLAAVVSSVALWLGTQYHYKWLALNYAPFAVLGTALSIFLAFRTNSAYTRWSQAAASWMTMQSSSRVFVRLIKTITNGHKNLPTYNKKASDAYIEEVAQRQIAWINVVRLTLRDQDNWEEVEPYLTKDDFKAMKTMQNKPAYLMARQGERIYDALGSGILQGFDSLQLETQLSILATAQANTEQIKRITIPRPYGFFTHVFVQVYIAIAPAFLLGIFVASGVAWAVIPMTLLIAFLFAPIDALGGIIERPFENAVNDVPIAAISRNAERDILEVIGKHDLPAVVTPENGFLF